MQSSLAADFRTVLQTFILKVLAMVMHRTVLSSQHVLFFERLFLMASWELAVSPDECTSWPTDVRFMPQHFGEQLASENKATDAGPKSGGRGIYRSPSDWKKIKLFKTLCFGVCQNCFCW